MNPFVYYITPVDFTALDAQIRLLTIAVDLEAMLDGREPDHDRDAADLAFCAWKYDAIRALKDGTLDGFDTFEDYVKYGDSFVPVMFGRDSHAHHGATARLVRRQDRCGRADDF